MFSRKANAQIRIGLSSLVLLFCFHNCSRTGFGGGSGHAVSLGAASGGTPSTVTGSQNNGGEGYDGFQAFADIGTQACSDGTFVKAQINAFPGQVYYLVRENCADISAEQLPSSAITLVPGAAGGLIYQSTLYAAVTNPQTVQTPPLALACTASGGSISVAISGDGTSATLQDASVPIPPTTFQITSATAIEYQGSDSTSGDSFTLQNISAVWGLSLTYNGGATTVSISPVQCFTP